MDDPKQLNQETTKVPDTSGVAPVAPVVVTPEGGSVPGTTIPVQPPQPTGGTTGVGTILPGIDTNGKIIPKHPGGRPCAYCLDKPTIQKKVDEYLQRATDTTKGKIFIPYMEELAVIILDVNGDTLVEWEDKHLLGPDGKETSELEHPEFSASIKKLKELQKLRLLQRTMGRYNPTGAIFQLKANHKMIETEKRLLVGDKDAPLKLEIDITEDIKQDED